MKSLAVLAIVALAAPAAADPHRTRRLVGVGVAAGLYVASEAGKDALAPDACRWCAPPSFDARVREHLVWDHPGRARALSNLTGFALAPLGAAGLLALDAPELAALGDDLLAVGEAAVYSQLAVQVIKLSVGRQRPEARFQTTSGPSNDDNLSFVSGHAALTFAIATAAGSVAQRRGYALAPVIWTTGLALATTTAYLRIAGDKHYLSDVVAGGALGAAAGLVLPRLLHALPRDVAIAPSPSGVALLGRF